MKIGIDARMYGPNKGGLGRYLEQLIQELEKLETNDEFVIFLRRENFDDYHPRKPNFKKVLADIPWYGWKEQILMPQIIRKQKVDLMHFPHWNIPLIYRRPFVVTIHDLILLKFPSRRASTLSPVFYFLKNLMFRLALRHSLKNSLRVITPSQFTKNDLIKTFKISGGKITAILLAPAAKTLPLNEDDTKKFLLDKKIVHPFVLYVGVAYPHKNLEMLIAAWQNYLQKYGDTWQLVLAGKNNYFYERLKKMPEIKNVVFTDFVTDAELSALYAKADLYVFPSLYEGFGIPPLEAMRHSLPVAAARASCLPEILEDAAIYFDPHDLEDIVQTIHTTLTDLETREKLRRNSRQLLARCSPAETAKQTWSVYKNVL